MAEFARSCEKGLGGRSGSGRRGRRDHSPLVTLPRALAFPEMSCYSWNACSGKTPIEANVRVLDADLRPLRMTYPKRAKQLVKKGRAKWIDEGSILLAQPLGPSQETEDMDYMSDVDVPEIESELAGTTPWVEYFREMFERLVNDDLATLTAVEAYKNMQPTMGSPDCPGESLARVIEAHLSFRKDLFHGLMEFVSSRGLK